MSLNQLPFYLLFLILFLSLSSKTIHCAKTDLVQSSCVHASFPDICFRTLSSFAGPAQTPRDLAQAAVRVSLARARKVSGFLSSLRNGRNVGNREQGALTDCVDQVGESVDDLSKTLSELQQLRRGASFRWQMSNAETWVSAALTNEDTCLDGFRQMDGKVRPDVKRMVTDVARVTSNALYLITRIDQTRG